MRAREHPRTATSRRLDIEQVGVQFSVHDLGMPAAGQFAAFVEALPGEFDALVVPLVDAATHLSLHVAFVDRGEIRRINSLRFAERREIKHYFKGYP